MMKDLISQTQIQVNDKLYLKDPKTSVLGQKIIQTGIALIDEIGFEGFTFGKLAKQLNTAESSIYRYFESKHKLLLYITSWYWAWLEYKLVFAITNINDSKKKLQITISILTDDISGVDENTKINLAQLNKIVISESSKSYLTKEVENVNKAGAFAAYKRMVARISEIILEINPQFHYAHALVSTITEGIHHQKYFAQHLPSLTDESKSNQQLSAFFFNMAIATITDNNG